MEWRTESDSGDLKSYEHCQIKWMCCYSSSQSVRGGSVILLTWTCICPCMFIKPTQADCNERQKMYMSHWISQQNHETPSCCLLLSPLTIAPNTVKKETEQKIFLCRSFNLLTALVDQEFVVQGRSLMEQMFLLWRRPSGRVFKISVLYCLCMILA